MENQIGAIGHRLRGWAWPVPRRSMELSGNELEVVGGYVTLGGRNCGTVSPGDHVELKGDERLYVNGIER